MHAKYSMGLIAFPYPHKSHSEDNTIKQEGASEIYPAMLGDLELVATENQDHLKNKTYIADEFQVLDLTYYDESGWKKLRVS